MSIFGLFIIPLIILFFIVIGVMLTVVRGLLHLFGIGNKTSSYRGANQQSAQHEEYSKQNQRFRRSSRTSTTNSSSKKKVIGDDEGEYVDFEEV